MGWRGDRWAGNGVSASPCLSDEISPPETAGDRGGLRDRVAIGSKRHKIGPQGIAVLSV